MVRDLHPLRLVVKQQSQTTGDMCWWIFRSFKFGYISYKTSYLKSRLKVFNLILFTLDENRFLFTHKIPSLFFIGNVLCLNVNTICIFGTLKYRHLSFNLKVNFFLIRPQILLKHIWLKIQTEKRVCFHWKIFLNSELKIA